MHRISFALVLAACGGGQASQSATTAPTATSTTPPPPPVVDASTGTTVDAGAPVASAEEGPCKVLEADRKEQVARIHAVAESKDPLGRADAVSDEVRGAFVRCSKTKNGGAWGFSLRDVKSERNGVTGIIVAVYVDKSGKKLELALHGPGRLQQRSFSATDVDRVTIGHEELFDYDGDGEDELIAYGENQTKEGVKDIVSWVLTMKGGAVGLYGPTVNVQINRTEDVDGDKRPDLVTNGPYRSRVPARCNGEPTLAIGPSLVWHSLKDGTFSATDDVAIAFAKRSCAKPGFEVAKDDEKKVDDEQTFENVACARLWGMSDAQVLSAIASGCGPAMPGEAGCKEAALKSCGQPTQLAQWAKIAPPLKLK